MNMDWMKRLLIFTFIHLKVVKALENENITGVKLHRYIINPLKKFVHCFYILFQRDNLWSLVHYKSIFCEALSFLVLSIGSLEFRLFRLVGWVGMLD